MIRIGYDAKRLFCNRTGLGNYSRTLVQNLAKQYPSDQHILYSPSIGPTDLAKSFKNNAAYQIHIANHPLKAYWRSLAIKNQLIKDEIDIYHGLSNELPLGIHSSKIKRIVTIHDLIFKALPDTYSWINRQIYDYKSRTSCQSADKIIAISESTKRDIIKYYNIDPEKITVIYQACDPIFYTSISKYDTLKTKEKYQLPSQYILYVGSITPRKNILRLIRAYAQFKDNKQVPLVLVGNGRQYLNEAKNLTKSLGVNQNVLWLENVRNIKELQCIYKCSSVLVYPSLYEGFGLPVAEAMLSGTPVITSSTSSLPEAGGSASIYVDPTNTEDLSNAIDSVMTDSSLRERMITSGKKYALRKYDPRTLSAQLMDTYKNALA